jgi:hypothetical protein
MALFPLMGVLSLLWFCIRVLPKPSRITYPCQRVTAPIATAFIAWILGACSTFSAYKGLRFALARRRMLLASLCATVVVAAGTYTALSSAPPARASFLFPGVLAKATAQPFDAYTAPIPNEPVGTARGLQPGRVVWVHEPDATDHTCTNTVDDYWWQDDNTIPQQVNDMLSAAVTRLAGVNGRFAAWDSLFHHFNRVHGRGNTGYTPGEKIAVKVNLCSSYNLIHGGHQKSDKIGMTDTSPQLMYALLDHLIHVVGVAPRDICIGDPIRPFFDRFYSMVHDRFPDVVYIDPHGGNGRTEAQPSENGRIYFSGTNDENQEVETRLPVQFVEADYMINCTVLKAHSMAGISTCAKNHYGSHCEPDLQDELLAKHLHFALPSQNAETGVYRTLVDLMGHQHLGGKTLLYLVDALWAAGNSINDPNKWQSAPFNGDWPSSLLASQDPVAIEAVSYDLLSAEYDTANGYPVSECYPYLSATRDYMIQAADTAARPSDIVYDPEADGSSLPSLGVYEHWNNAADKQYSRNLDPANGKGIELLYLQPDDIGVTTPAPRASAHPTRLSLAFHHTPGTTPRMVLRTAPRGSVVSRSRLQVDLFDGHGRHVRSLYTGYAPPAGMPLSLALTTQQGLSLPHGSYVCRARWADVMTATAVTISR